MKYTKEVKCVVWDLDNTIWDGTLLESDSVTLKPGIKEIIAALDARGIIHSIASKNNYYDAWKKIQEYELEHYFLYPEIHWNAKSVSILNIQQNLNIGSDTIVLIDDCPFERDEVAGAYPEVQTFDALDYLTLIQNPRLIPKFITEDSKKRRLMYIRDIQRKEAEEEYKGPKEDFLRSLNMEFIISIAKEEDLQRAEELTIRTNQLNATGRTYTYEELFALMQCDRYRLYVCELTDKYGSYGKIGLALVEIDHESWCLKMLLMSCRVLSRSVGSVFMTYIMRQAKFHKKRLLADFRQTDRNKMMYVTYKFANFKEISNDGSGTILFENDLTQIPSWPAYMNVRYPELSTI